MRFACDAMLGKLARWLRLLGHDVVYEKDDKALIHLSNLGFLVLTRDKELKRRIGEKCLILPEKLEEQLLFLKNKGLISFDLKAERCTICNGELVKAGREEVKGKVPESVLNFTEEFWICKKCGKVYWEGSHWKRMEKFLKNLNSAHL